jgi:molybdopterin-guanine dinucleotide biosynthesis protein A
MRDSVSAIILAGGRSSRMGRAKASLKFGSSTLLERVAAEMKRVFDDIVIVASPTDVIEIAGVRTVRDATDYEGPVGALERGMLAATSETIFACSCDVPFVSADLALALSGMLGDHDAVIPHVEGKLQTLHAVYSKECAKVLATMRAKGEHRLNEIVNFAKVRIVAEEEIHALNPNVDRTMRSFFNVNTPDDYQRALKMMDEEFGR